jgi:GrpB-like predicted nucleotidyltransferase (UPF0157 family)
MSQISLKAAVQAAIDDSVGFTESETVEQRKQALQAYLRQPYGNEVEGRSSIVTGEVAEAIDGALPPLMRIFTASDDIVVADPTGPGDEAGAKQATDYLNYIFLRDNNGIQIMHDWFKDALLQKNGIVKAYWEDKIDVNTEEYQGLTDDELALMLQDKDIEVVEQETRTMPAVDQMMADTIIASGGEVPMFSIHDVKIKKSVKSGKVTVENVPPEEFLIAKRGRSIKQSPFVAQRQMITRSDLIAMGFDKDIVESLPAGDALAYTPERVARYSPGEQPYDTQSEESALQEIEVFECYIMHDENEDGIAELRQVFYAGNDILSNEECDYVPFYSICPLPIPHKFYGNSLADRTVDLQLIKTTITRQMLDNLYLTNSARVVAVEGQVNLDDLLTSTAGGVIRAKSQGAVQQLNVQNVAGQSFPMLQYLDQVQQKRTGVTDVSQGLDANILQNVTAAAVASMQQAGAGKIELIARIFAETGVKELFEGILHLVTKYQNKERIIRLRGGFVAIDPRTWANKFDLSINVGLGNGNRDQQMAMLQMVMAKQEQMLGQFGPANPFVSFGQYRNTIGRMVEAAGFKDSAEFFKPITPEQDQQMSQQQPQQQQPDPAIQALMAKTQADIQAQQAKMQADLQLAREKAALELQLLREKETAKMQLEMEKFRAEMMLKQEEFQAEAKLKAMKIGAGISSNVEIPG